MPTQIEPAFGLVLIFREAVTVDGVDSHALAAESDADDPLTGQRGAAGGAVKALPRL